MLELEDRILVIRSDSDAEPKLDVFDEEPCHWRVFPKSEHYSNQLHILYEDRVEIISFVHDYFLDQAHKLAGFQK